MDKSYQREELARQRSYLGEVFHRSVTARLLDRSPVPVLVLPHGKRLNRGHTHRVRARPQQAQNCFLSGVR
ncbi:adenine nucleotide alpha hydrolase family protein [Hymenobacter psychrophilus]|uniref:Uncharacterized protein n=1 Tax=Hymenobacter psychrophilus TaxID=651662 RepID=A0A1H3K8N5_9BACT|nr:hypothetical protein [Hymenobacter psychrophilus]SDY47844.1 hypothetical protein SAMN04488069_10921 [Hymenobacter psychrophilus]